MAITLSGAVALVKDFAGVAALVGATAVALGVTVTPPWPTRSEWSTLREAAELTQKRYAEQVEAGKKQNCIILQLLRDRYAKEQADAQEELNKSPTSPTLQRARDEARANVEYLESEQRIARCRQFRAPISSSTGPSPMEEPWITAPSITLTLLKT